MMSAVSLAKGWEDGSKLRAILSDFNDKTTVNQDGSIGFSDWDFEQNLALLDRAFKRPGSLSRREMAVIIHKAIIDERRLGLVSSDALLIRLNRKVSDALAQPKKRYEMWTSLRLTNLHASGGFTLSFRGVRLEGRAALPRKRRLQEYFISGIGRIDPNRPLGFSYLLARTCERNEDSAAHAIYGAMDTFLALTSVAWRQWNILGGEHHAEAKLWQGPYQFFWEEDKFLGTERIWFNLDFNEEEWERYPKSGEEFRKLLPMVRKGLRALEDHPLRSLLTRTLKLLHDGMVSRDASYRLLRFWSAMENLFSESGDSKTDKTIERALFADSDKLFSSMKLKHLGQYRNEYVHAGLETENAYHLIQFLRDLVAGHVMYLIFHGRDFETHGEFLAMCDLPGSMDALAKRKLAIERRENVILHRRHKE